MNLVLDDAEEVNVKKKSKKSLGLSHPLRYPNLSVIKYRLKSCFVLHIFREDIAQRR